MTDHDGPTRRTARAQRARRGAAPSAADTATEESTAKAEGSVFQRHPTASLVTIFAVVFALLGTGSVFAGVAVGSMSETDTAIEETPPPPPPRPVPITVADPTEIRTCSIDSAARNKKLLTFHGAIIDAKTGEVLFQRRADRPAPTASVMKMLTATAAIGVLGPDYRLSTRVYAGADPGTMILVGGGDPTLSRTGSGNESVYKGAPKISTLASQALTKWNDLFPGEPITNVVLDATLWSTSDKWDSSWERSEQTIGYHSEVVALMVDGDRADPKAQTSPRSTDPVQRAGNAFVSALGNLGVDTAAVTTSKGQASSGLQLLGEVKSQPVKVLIQQMMPNSDNTLAEMLARAISLEAGMDGSAKSLNQAIPGALARYDLDTSGLTIRDGSGLSAKNAVPALFAAQLAARVWDGSGDLDIVYDTLPVAGETGTLASRFTGNSAVAKGKVRAKTGWIKQARTLSGIIRAKDDTRLAFAFYAVGSVTTEAMAALDAVAAAAFRCGDNLSNN